MNTSSLARQIVGSTIYTHGNRGIRLRWWSLDIEPGLKSEPLNVVTEVHSHPDGKPKRMLIDGSGSKRNSCKTSETRDPATGEMLAKASGPGESRPASTTSVAPPELVERDVEEFAIWHPREVRLSMW